MVGKWHQGFYAPQYLPTSRGFDSYLGFLSGCEDHLSQINCCGPCNQTEYGIGKVVDIFGDDSPAYDSHGLWNGYLLRSTLMSTWGFWPAVFRPLRTVFPGLGAGFLNLGGKMGRIHHE